MVETRRDGHPMIAESYTASVNELGDHTAPSRAVHEFGILVSIPTGSFSAGQTTHSSDC